MCWFPMAGLRYHLIIYQTQYFRLGGPARYLEIKAPATSPPLTPRISLVSVGYSYHAITADTAEYAKAAPLSRPITPPIYSTEIRDTTIITGKIKDDAVTSAKILDATINGVDFAKPCSLQDSVSVPNTILSIRNNGTGRGIIIDRVGGHGIYIDSTPGGSGLYVNKAYTYGIYVDSSGSSGLYLSKSGSHGVLVGDAARHGVRVNQADSCGLYVYRAGDDGVLVNRAGYSGVYVGSADAVGVYIDSAGSYGVFAVGEVVGGNFYAGNAGAEGLYAHAYNNISTDTAIRAYGKGIASGG